MNNPNNNDPYTPLVAEFRRVFGFHTAHGFGEADYESAKLQATLIEEEWQEYERAGSRTEIVDALGDLMYVTIGAFLGTGVPLQTMMSFVADDKRTVDKYPITVQACKALYALRQDRLCLKKLTLALNDLYYAIVVAATVQHINLPAAVAEIHRSNMSKAWTPKEVFDLPNKNEYDIQWTNSSKVIVKRKDGKLVKSPSYSPAYLAEF